jgi:hypothetical protein
MPKVSLHPETVTALLLCEGPCRRATQHWYAGFTLREGVEEWTLDYRCSDCGHVRVFGVTDRRPNNADLAIA